MMIRVVLSVLCLAVYASAHDNLNGKIKNLILKRHNGYRKATGANEPDLVWDNKLAKFAESRIDTCEYGHDPAHTYGENLYWSTDSKMPLWKAVNQATAGWASEIKYVKLAPNWGCAYGAIKPKTCGHYTQEIWSKTKRVGCAINRSCTGKRKTLVYCEYEPRGNMAMKINGKIIGPPY